MIARALAIKEPNIVLPLRVREAHEGIKPELRRAKRANPGISIQQGFQPAERATDLECGGDLGNAHFSFRQEDVDVNDYRHLCLGS